MSVASSNRAAVRRVPAGRVVVEAWRALTGETLAREGLEAGGRIEKVPDRDRRTLIACSAGCDSSALAIALASASEHLVLGHIVHDLRPAAQAHADRDRASELAGVLGVEFYASEVRVRHLPGNAEANAREARYGALCELAQSQGCPFVATAHHADDQAETMLMAAARGAGLAGLSGISPTRPLNASVTLIRPMLGVTHAQGQELCAAMGWVPAIDETNLDRTRRRAQIRHEVLHEIIVSMPTLAERLADSAEQLREANAVITQQASAFWDQATLTHMEITWPRSTFSAQSWLVIATHLRLAHARLTGGVGADSLSMRVVEPVARLLSMECSPDGEREYSWRGVVLGVEADRVRMQRVAAGG